MRIGFDPHDKRASLKCPATLVSPERVRKKGPFMTIQRYFLHLRVLVRNVKADRKTCPDDLGMGPFFLPQILPVTSRLKDNP